jgi:predicted  nucleic acid-binding Zn-ribbon protein
MSEDKDSTIADLKRQIDELASGEAHVKDQQELEDLRAEWRTTCHELGATRYELAQLKRNVDAALRYLDPGRSFRCVEEKQAALKASYRGTATMELSSCSSSPSSAGTGGSSDDVG